VSAGFITALIVAALSGLLSLSYEVVWFRVFSFITGGTASSFGVVLGVFLVGVALGSLAARWLCRDETATGRTSALVIPATLLWTGSLGGFALVPFAGWVCATGTWTSALPAVVVVAGLLGAILPLVAHFGIAPDDRAGERLSWLYLANIVGAATGSMTTGFVLLDTWPLQVVSVILTVAGALVSALMFVASGVPKARIFGVLASVALAAGAIGGAGAAYDGLWERLQFKHEHATHGRFKHVIETRSGVITVDSEDTIYGGGVYDGAFNIQPLHDTNMIIRPYALAGFVPNLRRVLMVGLSSGSWAQVIVHHPDLQELVVVEINPGYNALIDRYPQVRSLLTNPKVKIIIDDGRRWLRANGAERFDAIVMNTTLHWRGSATNLLSREFMTLAKSHLNTDGVFFYNTTENLNAMKTGCTSFKSGARIVNFMMLTDGDLKLDRERWRSVLRRYKIDGKPVFNLQRKAHQERLEEIVHLRDETRGVTGDAWFERCESILKYTQHHPVITEDNMLTEFYRPWDTVP
jgi:spermidine synthase